MIHVQHVSTFFRTWRLSVFLACASLVVALAWSGAVAADDPAGDVEPSEEYGVTVTPQYPDEISDVTVSYVGMTDCYFRPTAPACGPYFATASRVYLSLDFGPLPDPWPPVYCLPWGITWRCDANVGQLAPGGYDVHLIVDGNISPLPQDRFVVYRSDAQLHLPLAFSP